VTVQLPAIHPTTGIGEGGTRDGQSADTAGAPGDTKRPPEVRATFYSDGFFTSATGSAPIEVRKATPTIQVIAPAATYDGLPHPAQAVALGVDGEPLGAVHVTYDGAMEPPADSGTYEVTASYGGDAHYEAAVATGLLIIERATPQLAWPPASPLSFGAALDANVLNATADVAGTFTYSPVAGTVLPLGTHTLTAVFQPASSNYTGAALTATIEILDLTAPVIPFLRDLALEATSAAGAVLEFSIADAEDDVDGVVPVTCSPAAGTRLPLGLTTVACRATDRAGNVDSRLFDVFVVDSTAPTGAFLSPQVDDFISGSPLEVKLSAMDAVGVVSVTINDHEAMAVAGGLWAAIVPAAPPQETVQPARFRAVLKDAAGNAREMTLIVDGDGIDAEIDLDPGAFGSSFRLSDAHGAVNRFGWSIRVRKSPVSSGVEATAVSQHSGNMPAEVHMCGSAKYVALDAAGESALIGCNGATIHVTAGTAFPYATVYKQIITGYQPVRECFGTGPFRRCYLTQYPISYWYRILLKTGDSVSTGSPVTAAGVNTAPVLVELIVRQEDLGVEQMEGSLTLDPGEAVDVGIVAGSGGEDQVRIAALAGEISAVVGGREQTLAPGTTVELPTDHQPPQILVVRPSAAAYLLNQTVSVSFACADQGSGVAACVGSTASGAALPTAAVGTHTFSVDAADWLGNTSSKRLEYAVLYGVKTLFDQTKAVKSGATLPIRLQLIDADGVNQSAATRPVHARSVVRVSSASTTDVQDAGNANPDGDFRFSGDAYLLNLQTAGLATGTYELTFVVDGEAAPYAVTFQVR
jgi:hypothetical protein